MDRATEGLLTIYITPQRKKHVITTTVEKYVIKKERNKRVHKFS